MTFHAPESCLPVAQNENTPIVTHRATKKRAPDNADLEKVKKKLMFEKSIQPIAHFSIPQLCKTIDEIGPIYSSCTSAQDAIHFATIDEKFWNTHVVNVAKTFEKILGDLGFNDLSESLQPTWLHILKTLNIKETKRFHLATVAWLSKILALKHLKM